MVYLDYLHARANASEMMSKKYHWCILAKTRQKLGAVVHGDELTDQSQVGKLVIGQGKKWDEKTL